MKFKQTMIGTVQTGSVTTHLLLDVDHPRFACYHQKGKQQPSRTYIQVHEDHNRVTCKACRKLLAQEEI